jgi:phosphatidylserine/phosphatidylglycerophosphate/cardiolipin synthase-like enzyme
VELLLGRRLYETVIRDGVLAARRSVWIATANVKEMWIERRGAVNKGYISILEAFGDLAARGVELRLLHADLPSRRFRAAFDRRRSLVKGGLRIKQCPRVHLKCIIVDGERLYLGSANLTGAGLGAKGDGKRNFEFGFWTEDFQLLDQVQAHYQELWDGEPCGSCALKDVCPDPGPYSEHAAAPRRRKST